MWLVADCERQSNQVSFVCCLWKSLFYRRQPSALPRGDSYGQICKTVHNMKGFFEKCNQIYR